MGRVLHAGVFASATILLSGYVVGLVVDRGLYSSPVVEQAHLAGKAGYPHSLLAVWDGIWRGSIEAIIVAGVLVLILTPVAGLITSAVAFARRRDWLFTAISATVLCVIFGSFLIGWAAA